MIGDYSLVHHRSLIRQDIVKHLSISGHWLDLMNIDGWIPRKQILGAEALRFSIKHFFSNDCSNFFSYPRDIDCSVLAVGSQMNMFLSIQQMEILQLCF